MDSGEVATNLKSNDKLNDASATKVPQDTWFCYEWHQSPSALHVYIDSTEVTAARAVLAHEAAHCSSCPTVATP